MLDSLWRRKVCPRDPRDPDRKLSPLHLPTKISTSLQKCKLMWSGPHLKMVINNPQTAITTKTPKLSLKMKKEIKIKLLRMSWNSNLRIRAWRLNWIIFTNKVRINNNRMIHFRNRLRVRPRHPKERHSNRMRSKLAKIPFRDQIWRRIHNRSYRGRMKRPTRRRL